MIKSEKNYPKWTCKECAEKAGGKLRGTATTWHYDICGVCGEEKAVTEPRDFGYPKFKCVSVQNE